jgi:hypothetical protein
MKIGRRIYFDVETGNVLVDTGERQGAVIPTTVAQDIQVYTALSERNRETFDFIELPYGWYSWDFREGRLIGVDLETKIPLFEYPNPEDPETPIIPDRPLSVEIEELKQENTLLKAQNQALSDKTEFHDDVLTEMILQIYS